MPRRLTDLADVLRGAGQRVDESVVPDWRDRSRTGNTSWYVDGRPTHVMLHHTASSTGAHDTVADEQREAYSCAVTHAVRPVSNIYRGPSGAWYPLAAGPSNTNGVGDDVWGGGVPADSMNSYAVAIEVGNNGIGEPWTDLPGLVAGIAALCRAYGIPAHNVRGHFEWAPTRKIDPASGATATPYSPHDRHGKFDMDRFRADVHAVLFPPSPNPPDEEDEMPKSHVIRASDGTAQQKEAWFILGPDSIAWCRTGKQLSKGRELGWYVNVTDDADAAYTAQEIKEMLDAMLVEGGTRPPGF